MSKNEDKEIPGGRKSTLDEQETSKVKRHVESTKPDMTQLSEQEGDEREREKKKKQSLLYKGFIVDSSLIFTEGNLPLHLQYYGKDTR